VSFFLFLWTARSFTSFPIPRAHFVRGRIAVKSIMCKFQLSDWTNAVWTLTLSLPASYCATFTSCWWKHKHSFFGGSGETGPPVCLNWPPLAISSGQNIFLVSTIFILPSHFRSASCRWEARMERASAGHAVSMGFVEMWDELKKTQQQTDTINPVIVVWFWQLNNSDKFKNKSSQRLNQ